MPAVYSASETAPEVLSIRMSSYSSIAPTLTLNGSMDDMVWKTSGSMAKASGPRVSTNGKLYIWSGELVASGPGGTDVGGTSACRACGMP